MIWKRRRNPCSTTPVHFGRNSRSGELHNEDMARSISTAATVATVLISLAHAGTAGPSLAPTPPMGWNSWNCFEKDINEQKIRAIADAMVHSGMRDAGYQYLVLDDAWMAETRDENGRLQADPEKFPSGMKAIGDYIHSRGLKYGIYQDRGKWTCQQLPGSFGHEQIDMETFAAWGVDYLKLDSCFAENNGRMSSEDYAIYRQHLDATERPVVLSISDFGNAAWAWGGKEWAQLWRTSGDIYPWMDSVYHCAGTSSHDRAIHPAFNGLWQFAGPGHWNDPDMLQVGNLKHLPEDRMPICDRTHFGLWCILAAPLMAGNDLRTMNEDVRSVLTAPELIAVNQDPRGVQGYKIFDLDGCEIYNKPLADGTAAVMLLNKGRQPADITVLWERIGLSGPQPVRDLWARKDLGKCDGHFTVQGLGQHEHRMIKVGNPGPPLPMPAPMPLAKYTVPRAGVTHLSGLYYIWKAHNPPAYNTTFSGEPIIIGEQTFAKGFGCKAKSAFMFKVNGRADRFQAVVAIDEASPKNAKGRFRVYNEDFFANKVLWDSGHMTSDSPARKIDIELKDVQCLMLVFDGDKSLGNWADARVIAGSVSGLTAASGRHAATLPPLVAPWAGPYGGLPPFDQVVVADFKPAFSAAFEAKRKEIKSIADDPAPATFENTIAALERCGRTLDRVQAVYGVWSSAMSSEEFRAVEQDIEPQLAAFRDEVHQNEKLFQRIETVYLSPDKAKLTPEQQRLVWLYYTNFVRAGAKLDASGKARVAAINQRLATLYTTFSQNLLADEEGDATVITNATDLSGLPESFRAAAAAEAERRGLKGQWVVANTRSSAAPFLGYADNRVLREQVWRNFVNRGDHDGPRDNKLLISEILKLRAERAGLLGYPTHAHWRLENSMAKHPERVMELIQAVWQPAVARVKEEVADMQQLADAEGADIRVLPWDYRYYAEKVRKAKYELDESEVKPYLQLNRLRDAMFWTASQLYGFSFAPLTDVPVYHPDVSVWEVKNGDGRPIGLFCFDPYARPGKRSGAWMNAYRSQERFEQAVIPLVSNNCNFMKGAPEEPVLLSWDDAETLFHEFGHAIHGLCSDVSYPSLSGTRVARDFVELPSQIHERWLITPEVLNRFAIHYRTGQPMPPALVERIKKASKFNQGFATTEFLGSALVDMKLHLAGDKTIDPAAFERETLATAGMPAEIVMRHRTPQFAHIFAGEGYSAGYYSYLWADTLTADAAEAFLEAGGLYDKTVATNFRNYVLSKGNTKDPSEAYRDFRGRDAGIAALMRDRGFPVPAGAE